MKSLEPGATGMALADSSDALSNEAGQSATRDTLMWVVLVGALTFYGLLAFNSGAKLSPVLNETDAAAERIHRIIEQADADTGRADRAEIEQLIPYWFRLVEEMSSERYVYGSDSIMETEAHYQSMAPAKRHALSLHMMCGLILMAAGILQFWPQFRRRFRTAHRVSGVVFVGTAVVSMSMSGYHLISTEISDIYSDFVFYWGLWFALVLAITAIAVSMVAIRRKNRLVHLGWAAMAFGAFLTAPVQRLNWIAWAAVAGDRTFNEMNMLVTATLFVESILLGHLLFCINRGGSPQAGCATGPGVPAREGASMLAKGTILFMASVSALATIAFFLVHQGFQGGTFAKALMPATSLAWHDTIFADVRPAVLVLSLLGLLGASALGLTADDRWLGRRWLRVAVVVFGLVASGVLLGWGVQLGLPRHETTIGGVFYGFSGALLLLFVLIFSWRAAPVAGTSPGALKETLWFVFAFAMSPALLYLSMLGFEGTGFVPGEFLVSGDGYQLAVAVALTAPGLLGHLAAVYSDESRRYRVH